MQSLVIQLTLETFLESKLSLWKRLGFLKITFQDLTHVHASLMLYFGHDIKEISERLGHAKSSFTYDTYVHIMSKTKKKLIDNLQQSIKLWPPMMGVIFFRFFLKMRHHIATLKTQTQMLPFCCQYRLEQIKNHPWKSQEWL